MGGIHDQLFKEVGMAFPADLVTLTLPYLAAQIDLSALTFAPGRERFADVPRGRRWFPDLVAEVVGRSDPQQKALAHVEIEYAYRRRKLARLREYNRVLSLITGSAVHTAVVYLHRGEPGLAESETEEVSFGHSLWTFRYHGLGLSQSLAREYLEREEPLAWAFAVLMRPDGFESRGKLAVACLRRILEARALSHQRCVPLLNFVHTYVRMDEQSAPEYEALLRQADNEEVNDMVKSWADELRDEAHQKDAEKLRDVVLQQLTQRFGRLPDRTRRAIASVTSFEELTEIAKKVLLVQSPEELRVR